MGRKVDISTSIPSGKYGIRVAGGHLIVERRDPMYPSDVYSLDVTAHAQLGIPPEERFSAAMRSWNNQLQLVSRLSRTPIRTLELHLARLKPDQYIIYSPVDGRASITYRFVQWLRRFRGGNDNVTR